MSEYIKYLKQLANNETSVDDVMRRFFYEDLGYAKIDHARKARTGYPEVIFGEGKSPQEAAEIFARLVARDGEAICTRTPPESAGKIIELTPTAIYHPKSRLVTHINTDKKLHGLVVIATGGTSDGAVAEEAEIILRAFGSNTLRLNDVGVAGLHRLIDNVDILKQANCVIAIAGMEGALPSVLSGLVSVPVIAVPTSVGYGANLGGLTAMLAMLCSCAAGVSVVNIDNGFGAAYQADMINKLTIAR